MQYLRGWRALKADPEWKRKIGVAALLLLSSIFVPILGQLAFVGWLTLAVRRAVQGQDSPLPELRFDFDYLGKLVGLGFRPAIARFVYTMPLMMLVMVFAFAMGAISSVLAIHARESHAAPGMGLAIAMLAFYVLYFAALFVAQLFANVAVMRAELMTDLAAALKPSAVLRTTRMLLKELVVGHIVLFMLGAVMTMFGLALCYFGVFPMMAIFMVIASYFNAELYRVYLAKGGEPLPIGPLSVESPAVASASAALAPSA